MDEPSNEERRPFSRHHSLAQWGVLALNLVIVIACLAAAGILLYGKGEADDRLSTAAPEVVTTPPSTSVVTPGDSSVATTTTDGGVPETFPAIDPQAKNFLITGSDANACVDPNSPWAGAADPERDTLGNRTDSIMILRLDPATRQAAVLSFPRDLWVKIPGAAKNRINHAGDQLVQTIYDNFGVVVDHTIQVDFCAFKLIVDAVGGVTVPFATRIVDKNVNLDVAAGCHTFSGDEALAYVRSRHLKWVDEDGETHEDRASDLGRISRQQDFLRRTLQAALEEGVFNLDVARALIESLQKYIVLDEGLVSFDALLGFAGVLRDVDPATISTYQIEASRLIVSGNDVLEPKIKGENMQSILRIFQGIDPLAGHPEQVFETTTTTLAPGETVATTDAPDSTAPGDTVAPPDENVKGDIVPDESIICD